jgi:hypothetical protein
MTNNMKEPRRPQSTDIVYTCALCTPPNPKNYSVYNIYIYIHYNSSGWGCCMLSIYGVWFLPANRLGNPFGWSVE